MMSRVPCYDTGSQCLYFILIEILPIEATFFYAAQIAQPT